MHIASLCNQFKLIPLLTAIKGVDEAAVNHKGSTPLSLAIYRKNVDSVRALLELNVDTTTAVTTANTPPEIVELLRQHKARSVENKIKESLEKNLVLKLNFPMNSLKNVKPRASECLPRLVRSLTSGSSTILNVSSL